MPIVRNESTLETVQAAMTRPSSAGVRIQSLSARRCAGGGINLVWTGPRCERVCPKVGWQPEVFYRKESALCDVDFCFGSA